MDQLSSVVMGIVQGVLEWLPVSSEGQLFLVATLMGVNANKALSLALYLHLGTGLAALLYYHEDFRLALRGGPLFSFLVLGSLATGLAGLTLMLFIERLAASFELELSVLVGIFLLLIGLALRNLEQKGFGCREMPTTLDSIVTGLAQGLAILPGISRSASTISILLIRGFRLDRALKLSFMLGSIASISAGFISSGAIEARIGIFSLLASLVAGYSMLLILNKIVKKTRMSTFTISFGFLSLILVAIRIYLLPT